MVAKKRLTMFDALDGALSRLGGLNEAAEKAKALPFKLRSPPLGTFPGAEELPPKTDPEHADKVVHPTDSSDGFIRRTRLMNPSDEANPSDESVGQTRRTNPSDKPVGQTRSSAPSAPVPVLIPRRTALRTPAQQTVAKYFAEQGSHVATYKIISEKIDIPPCTVRDAITKLISLGWITKEDWFGVGGRGLRFTVLPECLQALQSKPVGQTRRTNPSDKPVGQTRRTNPSDKPVASIRKIDRYSSLSISLEVIRSTWPHLARCGFGIEQVDQIDANLTATGQSTDRLFQSLHHAEWELEHGKMVDKTGQPVTDPCAWVFQALSRTGYYRRPVGYMSPEEQAAKDAETEAQAVILAKQKAEQAQFEVWRDGLTVGELEQLMVGYPGGPKELWLKTVWKKRSGKM